MSLLRKASIVTTPTAYENGKILSVKPSIVLGEELVTNGDFATDSDWTKDTGWTISNGEAIHTGSGSYILQTGTTIGKNYKVVIEVTQASGSGFPQIYMGGLTTAMTSVGTYTFDITATSTLIRLRGVNDCKVTSISVKEAIDADFDFTRNSSATRVNSQGLIEDMQILSGDLVSNGDFSQEGSELITNGDFATDSDWIKGTGTTISGGNANFVNANGVSLYQNIGTQSGFVKITFNITDYTSGTLNIYSGGNQSVGTINVSANALGTYTAYVNRNGGNVNIIFGSNDSFTGSIDNVSVKEIGQDWTLGTGWSIGTNELIATSMSNQFVTQSFTFTSGKRYRASFTVTGTSSLPNDTSLRMPYDGNSANRKDVPQNSDGVHINEFVSNGSSTLYLGYGSFTGSITNIKIIEITEDTNLPRIDYTGGEGHWLFEPQSTNLITYSEDATNWSTQSNSVLATSNKAVSPDGTLNADKLIPASGSVTSNGGRYLSFASTASTDYSVSIFVKQAEYRYVTFSYGSTAAYGFHFDLQDGVIIQELSNAQYTSISREVESFTNGWYRLKISLTDSISQTTRFISVRPANELPTATNNNYATTGDGTSGIYVWGYQAEESSFATSYIPTNGSQITRLADAAFGAGSSDLINSTEGVLYAEIEALADDGTNRIISLFKDGDATNRINIFYTSGSNKMKFIVRINNTNVFNTSITLSDIANYNKVALSFKENEFKVYINGVKEAEQLSGSIYPINTLDKLNFDQSGGNLPFYGKTKCVAVFKEALNNDELECLTGEGYETFNALALANNYTII